MPTQKTTNVIRYGSRTFSEIKEDLIQMIRRQYPEILNDFTDSSVGSLLIDLNAGVGNNLAINTDRVFQETQLEYAQKKSSILNIAKNLGFNIPPKRPSVTVVDFTVTIPVRGDAPDESYYPVLMPGAVISGGGKSFETENTIDWSSPKNSFGSPNRSIIPNLDSNGIIVSYNVTKREVVINGTTKIYKRIIGSNDIRPFFNIILPDDDVMNITSIILMEGTNHGANPSEYEFMRDDIKYFEVDYLAQQRVFIDNKNISTAPNTGIIGGKWIETTKKFIKEYTKTGHCRLIFGSGDPTIDAFRDGFIKSGVTNRHFLDTYLNNTALGERLRPNHTLFIKYRVGGGSNSNLGVDVLKDISSYNLVVMGSRQDYNQSVRKSIKATNPIPAVGGNDALTVEQIRHLIKYNFSAQNRNTTLKDYLLQVYKMPGRYGSPFKVNAYRKHNKVMLPIIGLGADGKLSNTSNSLLKENIAEYLTEYRMVNDYIEVKDGKIINLGFEVSLYVDDISNTQISANVIKVISDYFDIRNNEMNTDIFLGRLEKEILGINGVMNILEIKTFNKFGPQYSKNVTAQALINERTGEISLVNNTLYSTEDSMFEIKYPGKDIRVLLRKRV
jgi:hypothetical protein